MSKTKTKDNEINISVRNLIEFVLRGGDLDNRFTSMNRALDGTKAHQKLQKANKEKYEDYTPEVIMKYTAEYKNFIFNIEGRSDGILNENGDITIDEIKTTTRPLDSIDEDYSLLHWAQVKCYAYMYLAGIKDANQTDSEVTDHAAASEINTDYISVQLTYYNLDTEETKQLRNTFPAEILNEFFYSILDKYLVWADLTYKWNILRDESIKTLNFPFSNYRKGQRELAVASYTTITEGKKIFVQAPTGIGKTISSLFPAVKSISEGHTSKIFYLTAKTITRQVAEEAFLKMKENGLQFKNLTLTAKDKICFSKGSACNPEQCEFAKGHFNRVNDAIKEILINEQTLNRENIEIYAKKHNVCPFEFSLDLSLWADCVICDYNYVFDPRVYLKRFFDDASSSSSNFTFLIDEAHNLVDRSREMFSAELYKKPFLELKKLFAKKQPRISNALSKLNSYMLKIKKECSSEDEENKVIVKAEAPKEIYPLLRKFCAEAESYLIKNENSEAHEALLNLYFDALAFSRISELYDKRYVTYVETSQNDVKLKMFCLDPSYLLSEALKRGNAAVFFSATLTPLNYFKEILGGATEDYTLRLSSPFDRKNLCLMVSGNISTKYKNREFTYGKIVEYIKEVVSQKLGNYLVFFPSYKYMNEVLERFTEKYPEIDVLPQNSSMQEEERDLYLENFKVNNKNTLVGFAVLGGIFSEGIDLKGDRLIGAIVVGVGLPQICLERNIIKDYFDKKDDSNLGFEYAYMYPGMNKVLQAAGRVIRAENDKGIVLLIDERFKTSNYQRLFPKEWSSFINVNSTNNIIDNANNFWFNGH